MPEWVRPWWYGQSFLHISSELGHKICTIYDIDGVRITKWILYIPDMLRSTHCTQQQWVLCCVHYNFSKLKIIEIIKACTGMLLNGVLLYTLYSCCCISICSTSYSPSYQPIDIAKTLVWSATTTYEPSLKLQSTRVCKMANSCNGGDVTHVNNSTYYCGIDL